MGFQRTELPSGIRVITERLPGQRSASLGVWVGTGSRDETPELAGATHFLEHLVFKGTPTRSALDIAQAFDAVGGDLNGFTTKEFTCFHARTLEADVPLSVGAIADMLQHSLLAPDDVESERNVVLEEIAMHEDAPDDIVFDIFQETVWADHALGRRVQGFPDTVAAMTRDAIDGYYRARYTPRNVVVSAAGAVDHARVVELIAEAFPAAGAPEHAGRAATAPRLDVRLAAIERDIEQAHLVFGTSGIARGDPRRWALGVLNFALGAGMSSRLFQEIREKRGLAYAIASGHQGFAEAGLFTIYAACSPDKVAEVLALVREQIEAVREGITEEELVRAIGHVRASLLLSLDDNGSLMSHLGKSELCLREILTTEEMIERVESVTMEDVRAVAGAVLGGAPWGLTVLGPKMDADLSGFVGAAA